MHNIYRNSFLIGFIFLLTQLTQAASYIEDPQSGIFLLRSVADQTYNPALLLSTDVAVEVTGPIAKVIVKQKFYNQTQSFVEGKYLFPLPETAAVNAMTLHLGERIIIGEIREREQAQKIFQQAVVEGKHAGLVAQERANLFTTQIANIAPQETILVEITYVETLTRNGNEFSFNFPMTLTPRYSPAIQPDNNPMPEATKNSQATLASNFKFSQDLPSELANPAHIRVSIMDMQNLDNIESTSNDIIKNKINDQWIINTKSTYIPMDRDFTLRWKIASGKANVPQFFHEDIKGSTYGLLMLMPPELPDNETVLARDVIFIIDTSGSMGGESIVQAKASLIFALDHLNTQQKFNIIEFNSIHRSLFTQSKPATIEYKQQALAFVKSLQASGGTEMAPALREALTFPVDPEYLRQVIFITDGAVSNENELFNIIQQLLGETRLFTVGIGSAPNGFFMKKAAEIGRGTQTLINDISNVNSAMSQLFTQLEKPLLRDIKIELPDNIQAEYYPEKIPDLYAGQPVLIAMKLSAVPNRINITGKGKSEWSTSFKTNQIKSNTVNNHSGLASLWARAKIESLTDRIQRESNSASLKDEIINIAITHQLVSQFTSFVAVEKKVIRAENTELKQDVVENLMPKGSATAQFPSTAAGVEVLRMSGLALLLLFAGITIYNNPKETSRRANTA
jgi:Ca-activated chloride channel homolog